MVFFLKTICLLLLLLIFQVFCSEAAFAWGPGVHTITALGCLNEIGHISPIIARIVNSYPKEYLYGCLAADFFVGKSQKRNKGHLHNWEGGFRFLKEVKDDKDAAYALGLLTHLAADVIAHNFFVPSLMRTYLPRTKMAHLYWEIKADYLVGPAYTKMAREILSMDNLGCDDLLRRVAGKSRNGFKAKKRLYTQSVKFSDYFYGTSPGFLEGKMIRQRVFQEYLSYMVALSCRLSKDFLKNPTSSPSLSFDPMGGENLRLAKRSWWPKDIIKPSRAIRQFRVDQELLEL
jgi:hypothetical protein